MGVVCQVVRGGGTDCDGGADDDGERGDDGIGGGDDGGGGERGSLVLNIPLPGVGLGEEGSPPDWKLATAPDQPAACALVQHPRVRTH